MAMDRENNNASASRADRRDRLMRTLCLGLLGFAAAMLASASSRAEEPLVTTYRCAKGFDELVSLDPGAECDPNGYERQGVAFYGWQANAYGRMPVYRCDSGHDHFYSTAADCEAMGRQELLLAYIYAAASQNPPAMHPLWRCDSPDQGYHLLTGNRDECAQRGWQPPAKPIGYTF